MNKRIVIVEPSPFRTDETYVLGPYGKVKAFFVAEWECLNNPYSRVLVYPENTKVSLGERVLWLKENKEQV